MEWISPRRVEISLTGNKKTNKWSWESLFMCYPSCLSIFLRWFTIFLSFKVTRNYCLDLCAISSVNAIFGDFKHFVMLQRIIWVTRFQMVLLLIEDRKSCLKTTLSEFCYDSNPITLSILLALAFSMMSACWFRTAFGFQPTQNAPVGWRLASTDVTTISLLNDAYKYLWVGIVYLSFCYTLVYCLLHFLSGFGLNLQWLWHGLTNESCCSFVLLYWISLICRLESLHVEGTAVAYLDSSSLSLLCST